MNNGHFITQPAEIIEQLRRLISLNDEEFSRTFLEPLSPEEIAEFQQLCPEFPTDSLPRKDA